MRDVFRGFAVVCSLAALAPDARSAPSEPMDAGELLRSAQQRREVWNAQFPGFTAKLRVENAGKVAEGTVTIPAKGRAEVKVDNADLQKSAAGILQMVVGHRRVDSATTGVKPTFGPDEVHPMGRAVLLNDFMKSIYRISDRQIMQVDRTMGESRFVIDTIVNRIVENDRYLPSVYTVTYRDAKTGTLQSAETYYEGYQRVGGYYFPETLKILSSEKDKTSLLSLKLTEIQLLPAKAAE